MKSLKIAALAVALLAGWGAAPAAAASIDYSLSIPLAAIDADELTPTALLSGTLSYDDDLFWGTGTFSLTGLDEPVSAVFSGNAWLLALGDDLTGLSFDGSAPDDAHLFLNVLAGSAANTLLSPAVTYCTTGCTFFQGVGATITSAGIATGTLPDDTTSPVVSPVPLPPAASLFGAALLGLGILGAGRRLAPARLRVRRRGPAASGTACTAR